MTHRTLGVARPMLRKEHNKEWRARHPHIDQKVCHQGGMITPNWDYWIKAGREVQTIDQAFLEELECMETTGGFPIGWQGPPKTLLCDNAPSAYQNASLVHKNLQKEIANEFIGEVGDLSEIMKNPELWAWICSCPLFCIDKKHTEGVWYRNGHLARAR